MWRSSGPRWPAGNGSLGGLRAWGWGQALGADLVLSWGCRHLCVQACPPGSGTEQAQVSVMVPGALLTKIRCGAPQAGSPNPLTCLLGESQSSQKEAKPGKLSSPGDSSAVRPWLGSVGPPSVWRLARAQGVQHTPAHHTGPLPGLGLTSAREGWTCHLLGPSQRFCMTWTVHTGLQTA